MPISRFLFFSSRRHSVEALRRCGPSKRIQSRNYVKSSKHANGKLDSNPVMNVETQAPRSWGTYVIPAALLGFVGLAAFVHYNDERRAVPKGQGNSSSGNTVKGPIIGGPFTLIDTENHTVTERNFLGKWVLIYFGNTFSPDVGPEQVQIMAKAIDKLESRHNVKVLPVFVTIDPQRDTPSQLRAYLKEFDPRIIGLTGPVSAVRQMAQEYRVYFRKVEEERDDYLVESSHNMYLLNPSMEVVRVFGVEYNADELSDAILKELRRNQN
ncbi:Copper chaperone SCO1/SenC [Trema orientale]|uniref:Copper chaperone SCO1/SenC n=1 Tax=Trema orientale TaxID=63057 RepID=A0A2P5AEA1_TREOI|nr:Copper chaperone SCO1/SenC [Trema orientale]